VKKSYRRAARHRYVTVRLPRLLFNLVLVKSGYCADQPVPSSRRRQAVESALPGLLVCVLRGLVEDVFVNDFNANGLDSDGPDQWGDWSVQDLLRHYSGIPDLSHDEVARFVEKFDI
jgi:hypothetical protein